MDKNTYEALNADKYSSISFTCGSTPIKPGAGNAYSLVAKGNLTISGVTKEVHLTINGTINQYRDALRIHIFFSCRCSGIPKHGVQTSRKQWLYFAHPFVLSAALKWFWERYQDILKCPYIVRALEVAMVYSIVALLPVLWLTFSAIDVSFVMVLTWVSYGFIQSFAAGMIFAKLNP